MRIIETIFPWIKIKRLENEAEVLRMQLAACGVAAMQNTEETKKERITRDNPYWTASYGDVCRAVDAEIKYRTELEEVIKAFQHECATANAILTHLGLTVEDYRFEGNCNIDIERVKDKIIELINK